MCPTPPRLLPCAGVARLLPSAAVARPALPAPLRSTPPRPAPCDAGSPAPLAPLLPRRLADNRPPCPGAVSPLLRVSTASLPRREPPRQWPLPSVSARPPFRVYQKFQKLISSSVQIRIASDAILRALAAAGDSCVIWISIPMSPIFLLLCCVILVLLVIFYHSLKNRCVQFLQSWRFLVGMITHI
ncbi:hypothetical protein E2562_012210 [Oryza meyeriana var. granulata]|uniref:Uncharacterized protein n=1 Tax=Oryza meyeriana var. granulata TaxID=110450 RepID=A0A6G1D2R4_9ORYZ|nr:hypothetical protein E2562_012210 [Oryza meyeriana var. granulata]